MPVAGLLTSRVKRKVYFRLALTVCMRASCSLDNSECAFRSEDFAPSRWVYQREAARLLAVVARMRGAGGGLTSPLQDAHVAVVLAGGHPRVLLPPGKAVDEAQAALSLVEPAEGCGGGLLSGLRLAAVCLPERVLVLKISWAHTSQGTCVLKRAHTCCGT